MTSDQHALTSSRLRSYLLAGAVALALSVASITRGHPGSVDRSGCHVAAHTHKIHCHAKWTARLPPLDEEGVFTGVVRWVMDGDTLQIDVRGRIMDVRLAEVDAPERMQPYGWEAALALIDLARAREVRVAPYDVDRYGRVVAHVYLEQQDIGRELVRQGAAWFYARNARNADLYALEQQARAAKRGLWALEAAQRIEPWEWRRRRQATAGGAAAD